MNKSLMVALAASAAALSSPAYAAVDFTLSPSSATYTSNETVPSIFSDTFLFDVTTAGLVNIIVQTTGFAGATDLTFSPSLSSSYFGYTGPSPFFEQLFTFGLSVAAGSTYSIVVAGTSGGQGAYTLNVAFSPTAAVPEPAAWALMILGFGVIGYTLRARAARPKAVKLAVSYS